MTLREYIEDRGWLYLVLSIVASGAPDATVPLGHPQLDTAGRLGLLDLTGTVNADDDWQWDFQGNPVDHRGCGIIKLTASTDQTAWERIVEQFEAGTV